MNRDVLLQTTQMQNVIAEEHRLVALASTPFFASCPAIFDVCYGKVQGILVSSQAQVSSQAPASGFLCSNIRARSNLVTGPKGCLGRIGITQGRRGGNRLDEFIIS